MLPFGLRRLHNATHKLRTRPPISGFKENGNKAGVDLPLHQLLLRNVNNTTREDTQNASQGMGALLEYLVESMILFLRRGYKRLKLKLGCHRRRILCKSCCMIYLKPSANHLGSNQVITFPNHSGAPKSLKVQVPTAQIY